MFCGLGNVWMLDRNRPGSCPWKPFGRREETFKVIGRTVCPLPYIIRSKRGERHHRQSVSKSNSYKKNINNWEKPSVLLVVLPSMTQTLHFWYNWCSSSYANQLHLLPVVQPKPRPCTHSRRKLIGLTSALHPSRDLVNPAASTKQI